MGFKRPEVQIFSPRPGRRGRLSVRGDFLFASLFKNPRRGVPPSAPPFPRNVRFAPSLCHYEHPPVPARLPHSAGALRALTIHETEKRPRRFFIRFAHQNPRRGVPPSAPPFPRNVRFAPSTLPLRTSALPRSLTTFRGRAPRDIARGTEEYSRCSVLLL